MAPPGNPVQCLRPAEFQFQPIFKLVKTRVDRRSFQRAGIDIQANGSGHTHQQRRQCQHA